MQIVMKNAVKLQNVTRIKFTHDSYTEFAHILAGVCTVGWETHENR